MPLQSPPLRHFPKRICNAPPAIGRGRGAGLHFSSAPVAEHKTSSATHFLVQEQPPPGSTKTQLFDPAPAPFRH
jgi:hypothetical protein